MEEKKIDAGYLLIKNYEQLSKNEKTVAHDYVAELILKVEGWYPEKSDYIIEKAKSLLFICCGDYNDVIGYAEMYNNDTLTNHKIEECYGFVPFEELKR